MPQNRVTIYLAGPGVFRADATVFGKGLVTICANLDAQGEFPLDHQAVPEGEETLPQAISRVNEALIRRCDAVVADMNAFRGPSMDPGTAYEMGFGKALGKLVVGYVEDRTPYLEKVRRLMPLTPDQAGGWRDMDGMQVEAFDDAPLVDNLMMACGAAAVLESFEEAVAYVMRFYSQNPTPVGPDQWLA